MVLNLNSLITATTLLGKSNINSTTQPGVIAHVNSHSRIQRNDILLTLNTSSSLNDAQIKGDIILLHITVAQVLNDVVVKLRQGYIGILNGKTLTLIEDLLEVIGEEALWILPTFGLIIVGNNVGLFNVLLNDRSLGNLSLHDVLGCQLQLLLHQNGEVNGFDRQ